MTRDELEYDWQVKKEKELFSCYKNKKNVPINRDVFKIYFRKKLFY
jgi:hypothetical protein